MAGSRVLVVEDDARLAATLERVLVAEGHEVEVAGDGLEAVRRARLHTPDLAVLDVMLPGADGITVCRRLRETAQLPLLMLTALSGTEHRARGLDSGADDYLVKPFAYEELLAWVRALLRRARPAERLRFSDLELEPATRTAWRAERRLSLTATELDLLEYLLRHPRHRRHGAAHAPRMDSRQPPRRTLRRGHRPRGRRGDRQDMSESSRPEAAFVLLMMQATFWLIAGLSALPFVLGGEVFMLLLAALSLALAAFTAVAATSVVQRRPWARRAVLLLEGICMIGSLLMFVIPLGANRGPVSVMANLVLPAALILLLRGRAMRALFGISTTTTG